MKQLKNKWESQPVRFGKLNRTGPIKSLLLMLLAALPLVASASTAGVFGADALTVDTPLTSKFDWPRFSLLVAGVIALVRARISATANGVDAAGKNGSNF